MTRRRVITRDDLRDELLAFLHAGRELEQADEEYLVDMGNEMQTLSRKGSGTRVMYVRGDRI